MLGRSERLFLFVWVFLFFVFFLLGTSEMLMTEQTSEHGTGSACKDTVL